jgi:uncharacterized protein YdhG (YjbR/CyaY superfamily)
VAKSDFRTVDEYLAAQTSEAQLVLRQVREAIRRALPEAEEKISYQIPAYRQHGCTVIYFAGWKSHYSIYPASRALVEALGEELAPYAISKGTIRFPYDPPIPAGLIARIAAFRADEAGAAAQVKPAGRKAPPPTPAL